jgi:hypothetical protein
MARQRIVHVLVHASSTQGVLEAMAKRMKHAAWVLYTEVTFVATEPL